MKSDLLRDIRPHCRCLCGTVAMMLFLALAALVLPGPIQTARAQSPAIPADTTPLTTHQDTLPLRGEVTSMLNMTDFITSYADRSRTLELADIIALPNTAFTHTEAIPSFGYTRDVIWHRLDLSVEYALTKQAMLEVTPSYLNFIDVFLMRTGENKPFWEAKLGDHIPDSQREYGGGTHVASMPLLKPGDYRMYVRVQSNSANWIVMKLWPTNALISSLSMRNLAINFFFGFCIMLGLAYLTLGVIAKDRTVVLYGGWVCAIGTLTSSVNGIVLSELSPEIPWMNDLILGITNMLTYGLLVFLWLHVVEAKKNYPTAYKFFSVYGFLILAFSVGATTDLYIDFGTYFIPSHALFMASMCLVLVKRALGRNRSLEDWWFVPVLAIPTAGAVMIQLALSGVIAATPLRLGLHQFTLMFHLVGMGILMTVRLARLNNERILVTRKAIATTTLVQEQRNLISMLSHEFRTPLAVIQRSAEMLMLRLGDRKDDALERLQRIQLQAQKLARLVDVFLTKDGIDSRELSLARELVPVNRFMQGFAAQTTREGAEVNVHCDSTEQVEVLIDETLMGLAITNLIETSRRFAHGRPITIDVRQKPYMLVEISIPCQGEELEEDEIRLISDALFRRNMEAKSMRRALGLHISQRIVDAHGGSIVLRQQSPKHINLCLRLACQ